MTTRLLYLFTRTPLHVGAGASVGAIDQPIQRERHTGFPIIPASSLKGTFADAWNKDLIEEKADETSKSRKVRVPNKGTPSDAAWLFGSDSDKDSYAGSLLFSEARVLAFPIRSAKGSFAWITCPLMLQRAARDGVLPSADIPAEPKDDEANFKADGPLALPVKIKGVDRHQVVLEEYCFTTVGGYPRSLAKSLAELMKEDDLFQTVSDRLVILSNGMMSHFANTACEVAQHVRISDETGTAEGGGLFNQENVPADTLFYSVLRCLPGRGEHFKAKSAEATANEFKVKTEGHVFQFGGDASTGLGFCTVKLNDMKGA